MGGTSYILSIFLCLTKLHACPVDWKVTDTFFFHIMLIPSTQGHFKKMPPGDSNLLSDSHLI